jgi:hypothetical protein
VKAASAKSLSPARCTTRLPSPTARFCRSRILRGQKSGELKIPHYLQVPVGHKTGETGGVTNDVGIIYAHSGPIIISFYNMDLTGPRAETEDGMGRVARLIVEYFDGAN